MLDFVKNYVYERMDLTDLLDSVLIIIKSILDFWNLKSNIDHNIQRKNNQEHDRACPFLN